MEAQINEAPPTKESGRPVLQTLETTRGTTTASNQQSTTTSHRTQRLPAYGRRLRDALNAGYRPRKAGGGIIVTSEWSYACKFDPARVVCPKTQPPESFDFTFLRGCEVAVLVPEVDERYGNELRKAIHDAGASLVVLAVNRNPEA